jgi:hypothetical protein
MSSESARELTDLLGIDPDTLTAVAGGPWTAVEGSHPGWGEDAAGMDADGCPLLFLGPTNGLVALAVQHRSVIVGPAAGHWEGSGSLVWDVGAPSVTISRPSRLEEQPAFLNRLKEGIDAAAALKARTLVRCQYCDAVLPPEHAFNSNTCYGCASRELGIVF